MAKGDSGETNQMISDTRDTYYGQQLPFMNQAGYNYGYGSQAGTSDYQDIMNRYRELYGVAGSGGGGGGQGWSVADPFNSYAGYQEFSKTGGYSPTDIANMRARGVAPVRAAYANAEREANRQRALQGGYSPNFTATLAKMAREGSQGQADALQNVNAGLADAINKGRLAGLGGMSDIESKRYEMSARMAASNAAAANSASQANMANQFRALQGMQGMYSAVPGMANLFGNQYLQGMSNGGQFGLGMIGQKIGQSQLPGDFDVAMGRIGDVGSTVGGMMYPW